MMKKRDFEWEEEEEEKTDFEKQLVMFFHLIRLNDNYYHKSSVSVLCCRAENFTQAVTRPCHCCLEREGISVTQCYSMIMRARG